MKNLTLLIVLGLLNACSLDGGGGGHNYSGDNGDNPTVPTPPENPAINNPDIDEMLKDSEKLFGKGNGLGNTPTELKEQIDNAGFSYMSFGAWGNVYDITEADKTTSWDVFCRGCMTRDRIWANAGHIDFTTQQREELKTYTYSKDASVANSVFRGPALMHYLPWNSNTGEVIDWDYGTMELKFGQDIANATLSFTMSNPINNRTVDGYFLQNFSADRNNVEVGYAEFENNAHNVRSYHGYGTKQ